MILGMSLAAFTQLHVIISLIGIVTGLVVAFGMLASKRMPGWTALFLATTVLTSVTGFLFPFEKLLPSHAKVPALKQLAPAPTEPPFVAAQGVVLLIFIALASLRSARFVLCLAGEPGGACVGPQADSLAMMLG